VHFGLTNLEHTSILRNKPKYFGTVFPQTIQAHLLSFSFLLTWVPFAMPPKVGSTLAASLCEDDEDDVRRNGLT